MDVNEQEGDAFSDISNQIWVIWDAERFSNGRVCLALPLVPLFRATGLLCRTSCDSKESIPYTVIYF